MSELRDLVRFKNVKSWVLEADIFWGFCETIAGVSDKYKTFFYQKTYLPF